MFWTNHQLQLCDCKCTSCLAASCSRSIGAAQWSRSSGSELEQIYSCRSVEQILWQRAGVDLVAAQWSRSSGCQLEQILWQRAGVDLVAASWSRSSCRSVEYILWQRAGIDLVAAQWSRSSGCQLEQILWQRAGVDLVAASWSRSSYSELQQIYSCSSVDLLIDNNKQKGKQVRLIFPIYQILTISNLLTIQYSVSSVIIIKKALKYP